MIPEATGVAATVVPATRVAATLVSATGVADSRGVSDQLTPPPDEASPIVLSTQVALPPTPQAPAQARTRTKAVLREWGIDTAETLDAVELVLSELVANAVRYAGGGAAPTLHLEVNHGLLIAVADDSPIEPIIRELDDTSESGRGMNIVAALVDRWGVEPWGDGKRVWVRIDGIAPTPPVPCADAALPTPRTPHEQVDAEVAS